MSTPLKKYLANKLNMIHDGDPMRTTKDVPVYLAADVEMMIQVWRLALRNHGPLWKEWKNGEASQKWHYHAWLHERMIEQMDGKP